MTKGEPFMKNSERKHGHRAPVSRNAWCELNSNCTFSKIHDMCHNPKCNCQKQTAFATKRMQLEGAGFKNARRKIFKGTEKYGITTVNRD